MKSLFQFKTDEALLMGFESWDDLCKKTDTLEVDAINKVLTVQWAETFIKHRKIVHQSDPGLDCFSVKYCIRAISTEECEAMIKKIKSEHPK